VVGGRITEDPIVFIESDRDSREVPNNGIKAVGAESVDL
jgi:hypothetical protein